MKFWISFLFGSACGVVFTLSFQSLNGSGYSLMGGIFGVVFLVILWRATAKLQQITDDTRWVRHLWMGFGPGVVAGILLLWAISRSLRH
jgi:hypothetical protein